MKLSEAIREGAKHYPQVFNGLVKRKANGEVLGHCALGSAYYAAKGCSPSRENVDYAYNELREDFPCLRTRVAPPSVLRAGFDGMLPLDSAIVDLNDTQEWTREQIADWLESLGY